MKKTIKVSLMGLLVMGLLVSCKPDEKEEIVYYEPIEPELQDDYTETAFAMRLEMVYVKGGEFIMGITQEQGWDLPESTVKMYTRKTKLDSYYIGKYEVTQAQWKAVMGTEPSHYQGDNFPVQGVSWFDALKFCKKLSKQTGKKYVLPTEAMWEYAARGGVHKTKTMYAGSNDIDEVAWYRENSGDQMHPVGQTHPVGTKKANALGIYDMSGNVNEWCSDWNSDVGYDKNDDYNPQGPASGSEHVWRGGEYSCVADRCRISDRCNYTPFNSYSQGFRVAVLP